MSETADTQAPVAIIGAGLRFPGGNETLDAFEDFLRNGRSGIVPLPTDRMNEPAKHFFQSHGFHESKMVPMRWRKEGEPAAAEPAA